MPRDIPITRLRNIGIAAHIDAGKTTCAERILFFAGRIHQTGEVHHGNTELDFDPLEKKKGITINAAATSVDWTPGHGAFAGVRHQIQIVDTPGHIDFTVEVERSLRVLDGAVFVLDASSGVECQSETVFRQAERHRVPCLAFVNKIDKVGADFAMCLKDIEERLGARPVAIHVPLSPREGSSPFAIVDLIRQVVLEFDPSSAGRDIAERPIPADALVAVEARRRELIEACAEIDERILAAYCEGRDIAPELIESALRTGTLTRRLLVVTCGSALKNVGIQTLLDAVVAYLPSPADLPPAEGEDPMTGEVVTRSATDEAPLAALVFKTVAERAGHLAYVRVYSGVLAVGDAICIGSTGRRERVGRIYAMHANEREPIATAGAGAIVSVTGLRDVRTGETLSAPGARLVLERVEAPEPVVEVAIEPRTVADRERLPAALAKLLFQDPSLKSMVDADTDQIRLRGMGVLHLEVAVERLLSEHRVAVSVGEPEVAYRETIAREARADVRYIKQDGGSGHFACVTLVVRPTARGSGVTFADETKGGVVPHEYVPAVEKGIRGAAMRGVFAGYPLVDAQVSLVDGEAHVKDSNAAAFEIAGSLALQKACRAATAVVLEPICALEVTVPEGYGGDVIADLGSRRGVVQRIETRGRLLTIIARAPLGATFDYVARLRGFTQGRGTAAIRPDGYDVAPEAIARGVLA